MQAYRAAKLAEVEGCISVKPVMFLMSLGREDVLACIEVPIVSNKRLVSA